MQHEVIMRAVSCAMSGKGRPLFENDEKEQMKSITLEEREETFNLLEQVFGGEI